MTTPGNVAVLLAGGTGTRVGLTIPKQLIRIAGKPILEHALATLNKHDDVDEIIVMMAPGHLDSVRAIVRGGGYDKVSRILEGAETRNGTTLRALMALGDRDCKVLLHDAVRPLLSARIISECFEALDSYDAVNVAIPSADTIISVTDENTVADTHPRASLRRCQTPQAFRASVIKKAYEIAGRDPAFVATDDCTVVLRYLPEVAIWVVAGDARNMKVTEPIDVYLVDRLFQVATQELPARRSDKEYRAALTGKTVVVFGGSHGIGADIASLATDYGANVCTFSWSSTGTHVERRPAVEEAVRAAIDEHGRIDFVVNTSGVRPPGTLMQATEETIYAATEINYLAPIRSAQQLFPHLVATGGSMLFLTSSSSTRGRAGYSLYSSANAAVVNLTQALADEWAASGVRVNCINPERTCAPMRTKSLLEPMSVARASIDLLLSADTGHIVDLRKLDPFATGLEDGTEDLGSAAAAVDELPPD